ncbi:hypothetical protein IW261DRAFT_1562494 [Armillaria novae-zelandiae]|uniref:Heterokaryon incompatibility domain-containing protein n=1 Tax=Armillaria novae-zelandiae TaxID=153914 RepID=A0AA39PGD4_9AGAR|nr:hypothetical protein IW261DRAFT_1562494 [Armillaria novae-zelandiae]
MLNLGMEYMWLDVLCLRQKGKIREKLLHETEWKLDVPTIGCIYQHTLLVIYLSGLGQPLTLNEGDLDSDWCWFRCVWTIQEVGDWHRVFVGVTPDGPLHAEPINNNKNYKTDLLTRFNKHLESLHTSRFIFHSLAAMQDLVSTNPLDRVAGLALIMEPRVIPAYYESQSLKDAWTTLFNSM